MLAVASDGSLVVRRLEVADLPQLCVWRSDPRVLEFYGGRDTCLDLGAARDKFLPRISGESHIRPCLLQLDGQALGYLQYYEVRDPQEYELADAEDTWAIDLFIGEPDLWGQGLGSRALIAVVEALFSEHGARRVVIDPQVTNNRAQRAYEKAGFQKVKVLKEHELHEGRRRDCWLMVIER